MRREKDRGRKMGNIYWQEDWLARKCAALGERHLFAPDFSVVKANAWMRTCAGQTLGKWHSNVDHGS